MGHRPIIQALEGRDRVTDHAARRDPVSSAASRRSSRIGRGGKGCVLLVGAGPGDPDLLTLRALRALRRADVVLFDNLASDRIVALSRPGARRIYVGKESGNHSLPQDSINQLLVDLARAGRCVVRLKGGDPFIFGRGGEEIEELSAQGIPFEVIPGVTSASGVSCYAGIPLTHREYSQSVVFVTGHLRDGSADLDWPALVRPRQTIVVYMGLAAIDEICGQLAAHGLAAATPAAAVERGTTPEQRVVTGELNTLPRLVAQARLRSPVLLIIGEVVRLRRKLAWFDNEPAHAAPHGESRGETLYSTQPEQFPGT